MRHGELVVGVLAETWTGRDGARQGEDEGDDGEDGDGDEDEGDASGAEAGDWTAHEDELLGHHG